MDNEVSKRKYRGEDKYTVNITAGLEEDLEIFMYRVFEEFEKTSTPRFSIFVAYWHQSSFGLIFCGRESFRDLYEFTEELFHRVKKYVLSELKGKPNNMLVRYAGLYLMYSLYFKQPCRPRVKFRIKMDELKDMLDLTEVAKKEKHWDVMYAWSKLFTNHAFHYVACSNQMGIEMAYQSEQRDMVEKSSAAAGQEYFKSKEFDGLISKVTKAHNKYVNMKKTLINAKSKDDASLLFIDGDFPKTIEQTAATHDKQEKARKAREESQIGASRRRIKDKFYSLGNE